jgi:hypothetical protein
MPHNFYFVFAAQRLAVRFIAWRSLHLLTMEGSGDPKSSVAWASTSRGLRISGVLIEQTIFCQSLPIW